MDEAQAKKIMLAYGTFYRSARFFYHRLLQDRLKDLGFRVVWVEREKHDPLWVVRLFGNLEVQGHLLLSIPVPRNRIKQVTVEYQVTTAVQHIVKECGYPIRRDEISVVRQGAYFHVGILWPFGQPGRLSRKSRQPDAFSIGIRALLKKNRN